MASAAASGEPHADTMIGRHEIRLALAIALAGSATAPTASTQRPLSIRRAQPRPSLRAGQPALGPQNTVAAMGRDVALEIGSRDGTGGSGS